MVNLKTFCLHHTDVPERKKRLKETFEKYSIDIEWVEDFHPSTIDVDRLDIRHELNINEVSVYLKHKYCFEEQKKQGYENILIFEDDVLIPAELNLPKFLDTTMHEFRELNGDMVFTGGACNIHPTRIFKDRTVYSEPGFKSRCAHCYIVNSKCIDSILKHINIMDDALDWKLNDIITKENLKVCYTEPSIKQATEEGLELSSIQQK